MVYRVKNNGNHLKPVLLKDGSYALEPADYPVRFLPIFTLESKEVGKSYRDEIIPAAMDLIRKREDPNRRLMNSVEISSAPIQVSKEGEDNSVWGVVTWTDIDLKIDYFSILVRGLTSAYKWTDPPGAYKQGDPPASGRQFVYKTLDLHFWRPGDEYFPNERELYFGVPGKVDYDWVYR